MNLLLESISKRYELISFLAREKLAILRAKNEISIYILKYTVGKQHNSIHKRCILTL